MTSWVALLAVALGLQSSMGNGNAMAGVRLSAELHVPAVAHVPFQAVLVHTVEKPGSDRTQRTETQVARDSAGRVFEELRTPEIQGTHVQSVLVSFTVQDPVAKVLRTCRPNVLECTEIPLRDRLLARLMQVEAAGPEDLGADSIGGLAVSHTRDHGGLPAALVGADAPPVTVTRDVWFSAELETSLRVVLEDAQRGRQVSELQITSRDEPAAALFQMPKGYKLVDPPAAIAPQPLPPGVERIGGEVSAPVVLKAPEPEFSEEARRDKFSGNVMVSLIVDERGQATEVKVVRGVGHGLDEKAVQAVKGYQFRPAMRAGQPVKVQMMVEVNFQRF